MKTFEFEGVKYNIIEEKSGETDRSFWEEKITDITRERTLFAFRPWWVGKKFRWLKTIIIKENLVLERHSGFDDGWTYQNYWGPWKLKWNAIEIL